MTVLIACEFSGVVRDAFLERGIDAISCDLRPTESPGPHIEGDVLDVIWEPWDMVIAHPPCNRLSSWSYSAIMRYPYLWDEVLPAVRFFHRMLSANAPFVAVENSTPGVHVERLLGRPDCVTQPWHFGHPYTKRTCFWLKGLPPLMPKVAGVERVESWVMKHHDSLIGPQHMELRQKLNATTFCGVAAAMAEQWGALL